MAKAAKPIRVSKRAQARAHPAIKAVGFEPAAAAPEPADGPTLGRTTLTHAQIEAHPNNPRKVFDAEAVDELAVSIAQDGLLQNLLVRPVAALIGGAPAYRLVAGERRWRAIGAAIAKGLVAADFAIPVDVRQLSDEQAAFLALLENMARKDLKPLEEARHFRLLIDTHGQTTATIAEKTGFTQRFVQQRLQLLDLKPEHLKRLEKGELNIEQARNILANYPKPLDLPAAVWLAVVEVYDVAANAKAKDHDDRIFIAPGFSFEPELQAVVGYPHYLLNSVCTNYVSMVDTGQRFTRPSYDVASKVQTRFGIDLAKAEARTALIRDLAEEVLGLRALLDHRAANGPDAPFTPWILTEAPSLSADVFSAICESKAESERRQAARAEADRDRVAADAARKDAATKVLGQTAAFSSVEELRLALPETTAKLGHPLPWSWVVDEDDGGLFDATGEAVSLDHFDAEDLLPLVMAAMNLTAGHLPTVKEGADITEDHYLEQMADVLAEHHPDKDSEDFDADPIARQALDAFLSTKGVTFADPSLRWTAAAAQAVARELISGELVIPAPEPEITDALLKLAGVKTPAPQQADA